MNDKQTTTSSTGSSSKAVNGAVDSIAKGLKKEVGKPAAVFDSSLYGGVGDTTKAGWDSALTAANNPGYSTAVNGAIDSLGKAASGQDYGMNDPGYAALRQNTINDTQAAVNQEFNASGRFGGGTHVGALGEGIGKATSALDYANFQNDRNWQATAAGLLPQAYQSSLLPSATIGGVGAAQDANTQAALLGQNDLFRRKNDATLNKLGQESSILGGTAGAAGTTSTTTTPATPWWQSALGLGIGAAGAFL